MSKEEAIKNAIYIQYPLTYTLYNCYQIDCINKLPLAPSGMMYDSWHNNTNHFTTEYHRTFSIPLLCKLFNLSFDHSKFSLSTRKSGEFDISILKPLNDFKYEIFGYTRNEHLDNITFDEVTSNDSKSSDITDYHRLYRYSHECSRLINKDLDSNRKLFISGDSQMIPDISFLSCFFKEIWYFDNRKNLKLSDKWENETFTDFLIEMNHLNINEYLNTNFK